MSKIIGVGVRMGPARVRHALEARDRDRVTGTFRATGRTRDGRAIDRRGVDIYRIEAGRIALKDSYWKQVGQGVQMPYTASD